MVARNVVYYYVSGNMLVFLAIRHLDTVKRSRLRLLTNMASFVCLHSDKQEPGLQEAGGRVVPDRHDKQHGLRLFPDVHARVRQ